METRWVKSKLLTWSQAPTGAFLPLVLGLVIGAVSRYCRPYFTGRIHYEGLVALFVQIMVCVSLLILYLRYYPTVRTLLKLELGVAALWVGSTVSWSIVHGEIWEDAVYVYIACWLVSGSVAALLLGIIQQCSGAPLRPYCLKCGYDLTGNVSGICPECGEQIGSDNPIDLACDD